MGSDHNGVSDAACRSYFNPRSPDGERQVATSKFGQFLRISIHAPRMGSDLFQHALPDAGHDFNPRSPDGERLRDTLQHRLLAPISIHAPRMGSDPLFRLPQPRCTHFNPRSPDGERHHPYPMAENDIYFNPRSPDGERLWRSMSRASVSVISIHAPRMGSDLKRSDDMTQKILFQSTLPGWGATAKMDIFAHDMGKIIHFQH